MHHNSISNENPTRCHSMQSDFFLLQNHSTRFECPLHPSSGVLKTVTVASGTGHNIGTATSNVARSGHVGGGVVVPIL